MTERRTFAVAIFCRHAGSILLVPDATGLMSWNVSQVAAAITTGKDKNGATICGMRPLATMTSSDAIDIGTYLLGIPAVANAITMTCR